MKKERAIGVLGFGAMVVASSFILPHLTQAQNENGHNNSGSSSISAVNAMAPRIFPSGAPSVLVVSGNPTFAQNVMAAQALAARWKSPLIMTHNSNILGHSASTAIKSLSVPSVSQSVQPYQMAGQKPTIYLIGNQKALSQNISKTLMAQGYTVQRISSATASGLLAVVKKMVAPSWPATHNQVGFPGQWNVFAGNSAHNSAFSLPKNAAPWIKKGVQWNFAEMAAVPLGAAFPDLSHLGTRGAPVKMTQNLGNAVGVTAYKGVVYAESDDYHLYALNARNGHLLWRTGMLVNNLMGNPIVSHGLVYVTAGDTGFPFSQVMKYELSGGKGTLRRGLMYSAIYAFNAKTGRIVWRRDFSGNAMPTPAVVGNSLYEATGGGNLWAFNSQTGKVEFKTPLGGFDSMSSPNVWTNPQSGHSSIIVGTSDANNVVSVNASTGTINWKQSVTQAVPHLKIFNTGMGDNSPSIDTTKGLVFQDSVVNFNGKDHTVNLAVYALNAKTGSVAWSTELGRGPTPPAYKAGVTMVHNGVVYVGSPVTSTLYALSETTGKILWKSPLLNAGPAGAGRGGLVYSQGMLWAAEGTKVYAINPKTGQQVSSYTPGGRYGIVNPVIVGNTMYLDNSFDWVQAIPLTRIDPHFKPK